MLVSLLLLGGRGAADRHEPSASLRLLVFDCGMPAFDGLEMFSTAGATDVRQLIVPCYVIEHELALSERLKKPPSSYD